MPLELLRPSLMTRPSDEELSPTDCSEDSVEIRSPILVRPAALSAAGVAAKRSSAGQPILQHPHAKRWHLADAEEPDEKRMRFEPAAAAAAAAIAASSAFYPHAPLAYPVPKVFDPALMDRWMEPWRAGWPLLPELPAHYYAHLLHHPLHGPLGAIQPPLFHPSPFAVPVFHPAALVNLPPRPPSPPPPPPPPPPPLPQPATVPHRSEDRSPEPEVVAKSRQPGDAPARTDKKAPATAHRRPVSPPVAGQPKAAPEADKAPHASSFLSVETLLGRSDPPPATRPASPAKERASDEPVGEKQAEQHQQASNRNYKNMTRERRMQANARERTRVHTISAAFEALRRAVPSFSHGQRLSKLSILRVASAYIGALSKLAGECDERPADLADCVDRCTRTLMTEGQVLRKKRAANHRDSANANQDDDIEVDDDFDDDV